MIPVVFVHYGRVPEYLKLSIKQASNKNHVILITDDDSADVEAEKVAIADVDSEAKNFEKFYHHLSKNSEEFEFRCFTRWALIRSMMEKKNITSIFYCDSDVLLFTNIEAYYPMDTGVAYSIPKDQPEFRWSASAHVSFFSFENISIFWQFILNTYETKGEVFKQLKNKYKHHLSSQLPGGVCDMTLLYLFAQENDVTPLCENINGCTFDHNINSSENSFKGEYDMKQVAGPHGPLVIKNIKLIDGKPYCLNLDEGRDIEFLSLHFQGGAKSLMHQFAR